MNSTSFFATKFLPWLVFWFVLKVVFGNDGREVSEDVGSRESLQFVQ